MYEKYIDYLKKEHEQLDNKKYISIFFSFVKECPFFCAILFAILIFLLKCFWSFCYVNDFEKFSFMDLFSSPEVLNHKYYNPGGQESYYQSSNCAKCWRVMHGGYNKGMSEKKDGR